VASFVDLDEELEREIEEETGVAVAGTTYAGSQP
jgi:NADH pyrophosphatase NudC (nudix superfamily)